MTSADLIALGQAWGGPLTALITVGGGCWIGTLRTFRWWLQYRRVSKQGPPSKPSALSLPLILWLFGGAAGAAQLPEARQALAKSSPAGKTCDPATNCPKPHCKCIGNDCRCAGADKKKPTQTQQPTSSVAQAHPPLAGELDGLWFVGEAPGPAL